MTLGSGRPFSSFGPGVDSYPPTNVVQIGIRRPRPVLRELIERRVHGMIDDGLVDEVRTIAADRGFSRTAAQALGYKEILSHLAGEISQDEAIHLDHHPHSAVRRPSGAMVPPGSTRTLDRRRPRSGCRSGSGGDRRDHRTTLTMTTLTLTKHHGLGNDFLVLLDAPSHDPANDSAVDLSALARRLCDRRRGIGADGLLVGSPAAAGTRSG